MKGGKTLKVHVEKDIYIPAGIYCAGCGKKKTTYHKELYCDEFGDWIHKSGDGTGRIVKCVNCFKAIQKQLTGKSY